MTIKKLYRKFIERNRKIDDLETEHNKRVNEVYAEYARSVKKIAEGCICKWYVSSMAETGKLYFKLKDVELTETAGCQLTGIAYIIKPWSFEMNVCYKRNEYEMSIDRFIHDFVEAEETDVANMLAEFEKPEKLYWF